VNCKDLNGESRPSVRASGAGVLGLGKGTDPFKWSWRSTNGRVMASTDEKSVREELAF
jgi:hypothetical protein